MVLKNVNLNSVQTPEAPHAELINSTQPAPTSQTALAYSIHSKKTKKRAYTERIKSLTPSQKRELKETKIKEYSTQPILLTKAINELSLLIPEGESELFKFPFILKKKIIETEIQISSTINWSPQKIKNQVDRIRKKVEYHFFIKK